MDSDFGSSMMLFRILPAATAVASILVTLTLFGPMVLYILARWRAQRAPVPDPHLGLKFALHWFATSALHLALVGAVLLIFTLIGPGPSSAKGDMYRVAFAMLVPAGIVLGVHLMLLKRTNDDEVPGVRRLFLGYNLIVAGLVGFGSLVMGFQLLFAKGSTGGMGHLAGSAILVYGGAWAALGFRFGQIVLGDVSGFGGFPDQIVPPGPSQQQPPPASAAGGGGAGLPPLGGGAYPPIDR
jgi:hypothetical protein